MGGDKKRGREGHQVTAVDHMKKRALRETIVKVIIIFGYLKIYNIIMNSIFYNKYSLDVLPVTTIAKKMLYKLAEKF